MLQAKNLTTLWDEKMASELVSYSDPVIFRIISAQIFRDKLPRLGHCPANTVAKGVLGSKKMPFPPQTIEILYVNVTRAFPAILPDVGATTGC
jgi:hypothetical protein